MTLFADPGLGHWEVPTEELMQLHKAEVMKYSDAEPRDERGRWTGGGVDAGDFASRVKDLFGTTQDIQEASFLLPDGTLLARRGTAPRGYPGSGELYHHPWVIDEAYKDRPPSKRPTVNAVMQSGVVRLNARWGGWIDAEMGMKPLTPPQMDVLREAGEAGPHFVLQVSRPGESDGGYSDAAYVGTDFETAKPVYQILREANAAASGQVVKFTESHDEILRKYSDSQPRVPAGSSGGGEWTSGGDVGAALDDYVAAHGEWFKPPTYGPRGGLRLAGTEAIDSTVRSLGGPNAAAAVKALGALRDKFPGVPVALRIGLSTYHPSMLAETQGHGIRLSYNWFGKAANPSELEVWGLDGVDNTPAGVMTHEFGHVIDNELTDAGNQQWLDWKSTSERLPYVSGYAMSPYPGERTAEAFAAAYGSNEAARSLPAAVSIRNVLSSIYPTSVVKYSDSQPRVPAGSSEGGEWAGGQGGFEDRLKDSLPNVAHVDLALGMASETAKAALLAAAFKFAARYPESAAKVGMIQMRNLPPNTIAATELDLQTGLVRIELSMKYFSTKSFDRAEVEAVRGIITKFYVPEETGKEQMIMHEFGHVLDFSRDQAGTAFSTILGAQGTPWVTGDHVSSLVAVSGYGAESHRENVAESFVQFMYGDPRNWAPTTQYLADKFFDPIEDHEPTDTGVQAVAKAARTIRLASGGPKRDAALNPIVAGLRAQLIDLARTHSNRDKEET